MAASIYESLDRDTQEIRFIYLDWNGDDDEIVTCRMTTKSIKEDLPYAALSYVWGKQPPSEEVIVNGTRLLITNSLYRALWYLRKRDMFRTDPLLPLWADALCIDQNNPDERGHQVKLMGSIFSGAYSVMSWLGEPTRGYFDISFDLVREVAAHCSDAYQTKIKLLAEEDFEWMTENPKYCTIDCDHRSGNSYWNGAFNIGNSEYWTRVWIFQELVLASCGDRHIFLYGTECVTYGELDRYNYFIHCARENKLIIKPKYIPLRIWKHILDVPRPAPLLIYKWMIRNNELKDISMVHWISSQCFSKDPRDAIYGLLGIIPMDITPDYTKPVVEVYLDWFLIFLADPLSLSSLENAGSGYDLSAAENLPSWLPNLAINQKNGALIIRKNSLGWSKNIIVESPWVKGSNILSIRSVLLDIIFKVDHPCLAAASDTMGSKFPSFCVDYIASSRNGENVYPGLSPLEIILTVLFQGSHPWESSSSDDLNSDIIAAFRKLGFSSIDDILESLNHNVSISLTDERDIRNKTGANTSLSTGSHVEFSDIMDYTAGHMADPGEETRALKLLHYVNRHKTNAFFRTEGGYLGIGPPGTLPGDKVCILLHSDVNLLGLLRRLGDSSWSFVGTCYTLGLTCGEWEQMVLDGRFPIEEINLR